jgi:hypothetical protein
MCLTNLKTKKEVDEYKKKQPDKFVVWKVVGLNGDPEYRSFNSDEPNLGQFDKTYKARLFPQHRTVPKYEPGFHAFRTKRQAEIYLTDYSYKKELKRFKAKREWITNIGKIHGITCLVLSHIKTESK